MCSGTLSCLVMEVGLDWSWGPQLASDNAEGKSEGNGNLRKLDMEVLGC